MSTPPAKTKNNTESELKEKINNDPKIIIIRNLVNDFMYNNVKIIDGCRAIKVEIPEPSPPSPPPPYTKHQEGVFEGEQLPPSYSQSQEDGEGGGGGCAACMEHPCICSCK